MKRKDDLGVGGYIFMTVILPLWHLSHFSQMIGNQKH